MRFARGRRTDALFVCDIRFVMSRANVPLFEGGTPWSQAKGDDDGAAARAAVADALITLTLHTALLEGAAADDDRGPCVARPALCASSSSSHMLAVPSAPARSTHGPALKIPPVRLTLSRAAGCLLFFKLANRPGRGAGLSWPRLQQALRVAAGQPLGGARGGG